MKLDNSSPKRLFTFGCSFTDYNWATWANIMAFELNCEFYNFGKSGAGNVYIANQITQANNYFGFNKNDLVIVCWTNVSREDRYSEKVGWLTPGNIYSQDVYDKKFVKRWANDIHFVLRDFCIIDLVNSYLQKTNYHFLSMCDIQRQINQWENGSINNNKEIRHLADLYKKSLEKIAPSFYEVLWNNDINNKWQKDWRTVHKNYSDGHPTPLEHLEYLESVFDYEFSASTLETVKNLDREWRIYIQDCYRKSKTSHGLHELPQHVQEKIDEKFKLKDENPIPAGFWH